MTGFGRAEASAAGYRIAVEISSVNSRKGLDLSVSLPRELEAGELAVRELLGKSVERGRVGVRAKMDRREKGAKTAHLPVRKEVAAAYHKELRKLAREVGCSDEVSLEFLLGLPGVLETSADPDLEAQLQKALLEAAGKALADFIRHRAREGDFLAKDLRKRLDGMAKTVRQIDKLRPKIVAAHREALHKRIQEAGIEIPVDDERLAREVAFFADRSEIAEEIKRLEAHFAETGRVLQSEDAAGRTLDFLVQEMGREINTIGSKANALEIAQMVIALKSELEKIREQVQNLE
jgi:uncharacterized protein (TIGR00255 family)